MGRQITANLEDLQANGCEVDIDVQVYDEDQSDITSGEVLDTTVEVRCAVVTFPDGRQVYSYAEDCLCFDCRNAGSPNAWVERWLINHGIPYVSG